MKLEFKRIKQISKKQKIIVGVITILLVSTIGFKFFKNTFANPNNNDYLKNQTIDGLSFENAKLNYNGGISNYKVNVINDNPNNYKLKNINIIFKDSKGKEIVALVGYIGETLNSNEKKVLDVSIDQEIIDIKNITYQIQK